MVFEGRTKENHPFVRALKRDTPIGIFPRLEGRGSTGCACVLLFLVGG